MAAKKNACTDGKEVVTAQMVPSRMARQFKEKKGTNVGAAGNSDIFVCVAHSPQCFRYYQRRKRTRVCESRHLCAWKKKKGANNVTNLHYP